MLPVFVVYSTFLQRCYDQLLHDCALQQTKMVIAVDRAGIVGDDGETHNGIYDTAFFNGIPNITVYSPSCYADLNNAFVNSLYHSEGPSVIRYPRGAEPEMPAEYNCDGNSFSVFGKADAEIAIVTYGRIFGEAYKAYKELCAQGVSVKLVKLNVIVPVPVASVEAIAGVKKVFFFEEGVKSGGVGESFASVALENKLSPEFILTAFPDCFVKQAKTDSVLKQYNLDCNGMLKVIKESI
jgi:1-deoxy-D-xylulose-5-phosphate synthase